MALGESPRVEKSEEAAPAPQSPRARANRRATGIVVAVFLIFSAAFIVDSTWILAQGAFDIGGREPLGEAPADVACYTKVKDLQADVDRAIVEASKAKAEEAPAVFSRALGDGFSDERLRPVEEGCRSVPRGLAAYSAVLRVRRAEETQILQRATEVSASRADLERTLAK